MATIRARFGGRWAATAIWVVGVICMAVMLTRVTYVHTPFVIFCIGVWLVFESHKYTLQGTCSECGARVRERSANACESCGCGFE